MQFIFGNSGDGYKLLYKSSPGDASVNDYMQKTTKFDVNSGINSYACKTDSTGVELKVIFNMYAKDADFERGAYYNHVVWNNCGRDYFSRQDFLNDILQNFASQDDVRRLRETNKLDIPGGEYINSDSAAIDKNSLCAVLHSIYSGQKAIIFIDPPEYGDFNLYARKIIREIFAYLNVNMRISTSYITSCSPDLFANSDYRLCVTPKAVSGAIPPNINAAVIKPGETGEFNITDDWGIFVKWLISCGKNERDGLFDDYERVIGRYEITRSIPSLHRFKTALEYGDAALLSKLLLDHVRFAVIKGEKYIIPDNLREKLKKYHGANAHALLSGVPELDNPDEFIGKNYITLTYLLSLYDKEPIPGLNDALSLRLSENKPARINEPDKLTAKYNAKIKSGEDIEKLIYSSMLPFLEKEISETRLRQPPADFSSVKSDRPQEPPEQPRQNPPPEIQENPQETAAAPEPNPEEIPEKTKSGPISGAIIAILLVALVITASVLGFLAWKYIINAGGNVTPTSEPAITQIYLKERGKYYV